MKFIKLTSKNCSDRKDLYLNIDAIESIMLSKTRDNEEFTVIFARSGDANNKYWVLESPETILEMIEKVDR